MSTPVSSPPDRKYAVFISYRHADNKEQGSWNVERLLRGWRWAEKKDVAQKLSAIRELPHNLHTAGFEVYSMEKDA